jgi:hypothetical protein
MDAAITDPARCDPVPNPCATGPERSVEPVIQALERYMDERGIP